MDDDRRRWLERLIDATERALAERRREDPKLHQRLIHDLEQLHKRLTAELRNSAP